MARDIQIGRGIVTVDLSRNLHDLVERVVRDIHGETIEEIGKTLDALQAEAEADWPRARGLDGKPRPRHRGEGHSADQFDQRITVYTDAIEGVLSNSSPHAYVIRSGQVGKSDSAMQKIHTRRRTARGTLETIKGYRARLRYDLPRKSHAWQKVVVKPGRKKGIALAEALSAILGDAARGRG